MLVERSGLFAEVTTDVTPDGNGGGGGGISLSISATWFRGADRYSPPWGGVAVYDWKVRDLLAVQDSRSS